MRGLLKASWVAALAGGLAASPALAAGVFADFGGSYRGAGRVSDIHGNTETLSCRSHNTPSQDGIALNMSLVCASDSYKVDFHADLYTDGHALRGTWSETTRSANGNVNGTIEPSLINAIADAPGFNAKIAVQVDKTGRLNVVLNATGTNVNHVEVSMKK